MKWEHLLKINLLPDQSGQDIQAYEYRVTWPSCDICKCYPDP